ncbi:FACT complex subunit ctc-2 [Daldinia childiae]|uniref:FACT complex subunit ctc-2 n=1 Tax=Daldinia childiae TaxID=326645 RepID=UPI001445C47F|nr:FACT complex subunit ctc-2 [Daldinia childiae]KAF3058390.1 FACT complex subunit ctc-2 [Daldinia childiae]
MKKEATKKEQEKKDMEDVVEQEKLVEIRNRRPPVMDNVFIRPAMEGKRVPGKVEIHQNDPIIIGNKKKTKDVQFYREATDIQFDETGNRKRKYRHGDEDEFEQEQEDRRHRADLDRQFKSFADKIAEAGKNEGVEVDMPLRELGFNGVPFRSNVTIQPTTDCLIQITEPPFLVVTLDDIEVAHLERNESDDDDGQEEEEESNFEIDESELEEASESSEDDSEYDSNASEDASDEGSEDKEDDEEGEDWDELEKKAKRKDRESGLEKKTVAAIRSDATRFFA